MFPFIFGTPDTQSKTTHCFIESRVTEFVSHRLTPDVIQRHPGCSTLTKMYKFRKPFVLFYTLSLVWFINHSDFINDKPGTIFFKLMGPNFVFRKE